MRRVWLRRGGGLGWWAINAEKVRYWNRNQWVGLKEKLDLKHWWDDYMAVICVYHVHSVTFCSFGVIIITLFRSTLWWSVPYFVTNLRQMRRLWGTCRLIMVADKIISLGIISNQRNKNNFHLMDFYGFDFILLLLVGYIISHYLNFLKDVTIYIIYTLLSL